jgi:DNA-binding NarL/FixJ family response regulator
MTPAKKKPVPQPEPEFVRILIVDDHPVVRHGMTRLIEEEADLKVCGQAADAVEALKVVRETEIDLAVVDITLKSGSGIDLVKSMKALAPGVKVLVASMHDEVIYAERALHAGALGYINKEEAADKIVEAIRTVLEGRVFLSDRMTERMMSRLAYGEKETDRPATDTLSDRELEVFEQIGRGLGTRQIAESLHLSRKTIETHRASIKKKLNLRDGAELVGHAVRWVMDGTK